MPGPGEPLFLPGDTAGVIALAEEEADTCPKCGMPKAWCRDNKAGRSRFDVSEAFCWATYRVALRQAKHEKENHSTANRAAMVVSANFRKGHEPAIDAGLNIEDGGAGG